MDRTATPDEGMAMITALLVIMTLTIFVVTSLSFALHSLNTTAVNRKQTQSISAAEAGIDLTLQNMAGSATLPCRASGALSTTPTQSSYSAIVTYYDATGTALSCVTAAGPTATPAAAEIVSTGTTNSTAYGNEVMHAYVKLSPVTGSPFADMIFANSNMNFANHTTLSGNGGNNANLYTNASYACANNESVAGSIYAQGDITSANTCTALGDWWAAGSISATGNGSVGGNVYAGGATAGSAGTITVSSNFTVAGNATAKGAISPTPCGSGQPIAGQCSANSNPGGPPTQAFPVLDYNGSAWTAGGFAVKDDTSYTTCASSNRLYTDLAAMAGSTTPTVFLTTCDVDFGANTWTFGADVAVVSSGGMSTSGRVSFQSATSATHNLYLIVPYHQFNTSTSVSCPGGPGDVTFSNNTAYTSLNVFVYTPCNVSFSNNQSFRGQIYAGDQVTMGQHLSASFDQFAVPGAPAGASTGVYAVALEYERQG